MAGLSTPLILVKCNSKERDNKVLALGNPSKLSGVQQSCIETKFLKKTSFKRYITKAANSKIHRKKQTKKCNCNWNDRRPGRVPCFSTRPFSN